MKIALQKNLTGISADSHCSKKRGKVKMTLLFTTQLAEAERLLKEQQHLVAELEKAQREIRGLKKMITMCAWKDKVKMEDKWVRIEEFLTLSPKKQ